MRNAIVAEYKCRDLQGLKNDGVLLSTPSNEAAKMLDALTIQLVGWYENDSLGGISGTVQRIREADPDYVLGPLLETSFKLSSHTLETSPELQASLAEMENLVTKRPVTEWEMKHIEAIRHYAKGYPKKTLEIWKDLVLKNPLDLLTLRMAVLLSLYFGQGPEMRAMLEKILPYWKPHMPMCGYVYGMYGFILNESKCFTEAEKYASKAVEINPCDAWSTHATAHIMDNTDRAEQGRIFMEKNEDNWKTGTFLLEHNYWHWALFYVEKGDYESAFGILDNHIISKFNVGSFAALRDASSLLYRLELEGVPTGHRWQKVNSCWLPSEHAWVFNDVHRMMTYVGAKDYESADSLLDSCNEFIRNGEGTNWQAIKEVGMSLCEGIMAFDKGQYDDAVEILYPVRGDVFKIGGSNSQRDVFDLLLIHAAIRSSKDDNRNLASKLIKERKDLLGNTGQTQRIEEQLMKRLPKQ